MQFKALSHAGNEIMLSSPLAGLRAVLDRVKRRDRPELAPNLAFVVVDVAPVPKSQLRHPHPSQKISRDNFNLFHILE